MLQPPITKERQTVATAGSIQNWLLRDDGVIPNNPHLPLVVYVRAFDFVTCDPAEEIEQRFLANGWGGTWRNGIFAYHHFHSTAHEVLAIASGDAKVQFGGDLGPILHVSEGDAIVIPAGVGHKRLDSSDKLVVVGAYPPGQIWDVMTGEPHERTQALRNIAHVPTVATDPILGIHGPLLSLWNAD